MDKMMMKQKHMLNMISCDLYNHRHHEGLRVVPHPKPRDYTRLHHGPEIDTQRAETQHRLPARHLQLLPMNMLTAGYLSQSLVTNLCALPPS